ncbi:whole genome shotgun sequence [Seminavis robusta]|uniref:Whole genome shotgun sequence n=1 Tax=Seminavis robusta TaxID=568900 RepID=A0A9N8EHM8_9STRA|nr:whole genome shotgun sequence [Seminavis robusta]|eukprot:Sro1095_g240620.1 whole genome shotgun sequence (297) ;mRNA; r:3342-4363
MSAAAVTTDPHRSHHPGSSSSDVSLPIVMPIAHLEDFLFGLTPEDVMLPVPTLFPYQAIGGSMDPGNLSSYASTRRNSATTLATPEAAGSICSSSTTDSYGVNVVNQTLLDARNVRGSFTGTIDRTTGLPHGVGRMEYDDKRVYNGEWFRGRWNGNGQAKFANGDVYKGAFRLDRRHGYGKYKFHDGKVFEGECHEDRRHGKGLFLWPDGSKYQGDFFRGVRHGHGTYTTPDGSQYTGQWKGGRFHGVGTYQWADGKRYSGGWRDGLAHGIGKETLADGTVSHDGRWDKGSAVFSC